MVKTESSWLCPPHPTWQSPNFNCMSTSLELAQLGCWPACMNPGTLTGSANMPVPGFALQGVAPLKSQAIIEPQEFPQGLPLRIQNSFNNTGPYLKENPSVCPPGFGRDSTLNEAPGLRRFIVFDRSGTETRLIYSSLCPFGLKPTIAGTKPNHGHLHHEDYVAKLDQTKLKLDEEVDENHPAGEESEMHEDDEEIDALLYSDDDDSDDDFSDNHDDDELTSTGHSPLLVRGTCDIQEQVEVITDEVASSDGQNKRQKLLDGYYKKASVLNTGIAEKVAGHCGYGDDAESSHAFGKNQEAEMTSVWGNKQFRKDKIRATLEVLERMIPGAKGKDPLLVLDVSIDYLKSLKSQSQDFRRELSVSFT